MEHQGYLFNNFGHIIQGWADGSNDIYTYQKDGILICVSKNKQTCFDKMAYIKQLES
jgi:hypothetical protein